jgi:hypothetical protein
MPNNILITPGSASIAFSGSAANTIRLQVEPSGSVVFYGNSGSLFGISDVLSGSLMSVNDISGIPILEVFSDNRVVMGTFGAYALTVTGSNALFGGVISGSSSNYRVVLPVGTNLYATS